MQFVKGFPRQVKKVISNALVISFLITQILPARVSANQPAALGRAEADASVGSNRHGRLTEASASASSDISRLRHVLNTGAFTFEANRGQAGRRVKFLARGAGHSIYFTPDEVVMGLRPESAESVTGEAATPGKASGNPPRKGAAIRTKFPGAKTNPRLEGLDRRQGAVNYFVGSDPNRWRTNLPSYSGVKYNQLYPGVDLVYYGTGQNLEYDFVVAPGADPRVIRMEFKGATRMEVDGEGDLVLHTAAGPLRHRKPFIYQEVGGERRQVSGSYVIRAKRQVGFQVGSYDRTKPLVIDPVVVHSTFLGGNGGLPQVQRDRRAR